MHLLRALVLAGIGVLASSEYLGTLIQQGHHRHVATRGNERCSGPMGCQPTAIRSKLAGPSLKLRAGHSAAAVARARSLLVLSNAGYGSYAVIIKALNMQGGEPLGAVFITCVRYNILALIALTFGGLRQLEARLRAGSSERSKKTKEKQAISGALLLASFELSCYVVPCMFFSIYGTSRMPAMMSEIFAGTDHVSARLLSLSLSW